MASSAGSPHLVSLGPLTDHQEWSRRCRRCQRAVPLQDERCCDLAVELDARWTGDYALRVVCELRKPPPGWVTLLICRAHPETGKLWCVGSWTGQPTEGAGIERIETTLRLGPARPWPFTLAPPQGAKADLGPMRLLAVPRPLDGKGEVARVDWAAAGIEGAEDVR